MIDTRFCLRWRRKLRAAAFAVPLALSWVNGFGADSPIRVEGPLQGAPSVRRTTTFDLGKVGYQQSEFIFTGMANSYQASSPLSADGRWTTRPGASEKYGSRLIVYRPSDPKKFNGTVFVEWMNVSNGQADINPDWHYVHNEIIREGAAWVGVSAQAIGVNGAKAAQPQRYAALVHPGDSFSYDIFGDAGMVVRHQGARILPGLSVRKVIAVGESQSAGRLVTYINAVHAHHRVYDGFFVHSRGASGAALSQAPQPAVSPPPMVQIRDDLDAPVFIFQTETDVANSKAQVRQPDSNRLRTWEVAGTAHGDQYLELDALEDDGHSPAAIDGFATALLHPRTSKGARGGCDVPYNGGPHYWVANAALHALQAWVAQKKAPPKSPYLDVASQEPFELAHDSRGNVTGGIRTPYVDVAVAKLGPYGQPADCRIFGTTEPFSTQELASLYRTPANFVARWTASTDDAVHKGFVVAADRARLLAVGRKLSEAVP